ncbi:hypothetical protein B0H13DRAFT_2654011 [Mycena leptocephala]|nr:hypothetical protein B0H13DRAFT_2654011 [Mycena leptocephala]
MSVLLPLTASQCPPTDTDGGPIGTGFVSGLVCVYPGVDCTYYASDGALSLDASTRCPNLLLTGTQSPSSLATESQCPPTDNDGGTLAAGVGSLICIYPNLDCFYRASNGSLSDGSSTRCPHPLLSVPQSSKSFSSRTPTGSQSSSSAATAQNQSSRTTASGTVSTPQGTGDVSESMTVRNHIPVRVITGISVALAIVVLCFVVSLLVRVRSGRRAAKIGTIEINPRASTISPFTLITEAGDVNNDSSSDTPRTRANTIARRQLEKQLRAVQEKMVDLEDIERRLRQASSRGSPAVHAELQAAKEQINRLVERINALEANANWAYSEGISEDPPPDYV